MNFPEILPAYLHALLKRQGHTFTYAHNALHPAADVVLIQTSIVNYTAELEWAARLKREHPGKRIGFVGGMASNNPHLYLEASGFGQDDFVVAGEAENALLEADIADFSGLVNGELVDNLDDLPFPDWSHLGDQKTRDYTLLRTPKGRFLPMQSSRGCPMSCGFYCTYPLVQGAKFRARSPENVVAEIEYLQNSYDVTTVMFRDPIFSLKMGRVERICELILKKGLKLSWICETHPRYLNPELDALMARAGCVTVKLGVESGDLEVMSKSRRAAPDLLYQEEIIRCLEQHGIDVLAFYILGYFDDTHRSVLRTIEYAERLNTYGAQFTIATPYPGTGWYKDLQRQGHFDLDENYEHYNQYRLVYNHPNLGAGELEDLKNLAYRRYYPRWAYVKKNFLKRSATSDQPSESAS
jgi:radical SAM superfamily enzyme YgiQ (UPF0313 family)